MAEFLWAPYGERDYAADEVLTADRYAARRAFVHEVGAALGTALATDLRDSQVARCHMSAPAHHSISVSILHGLSIHHNFVGSQAAYSGCVDPAKKIELLDQQIDQAKNGSPDDFNLWKSQTEVVLRAAVGDTNPLYASFTAIRYSPALYSSGSPNSVFDDARRNGVRRAVAILKSAKLEVELTGGSPTSDSASTVVGTRVFVVHGHDDAVKHEVARFLAALTGNEPVILHEQPNGGKTVIEKFEDYASEAAYAVILATADDLGRATSEVEMKARARQNVVFELGFFFGALGRAKVAMLHDESIERPSDVAGLVTIPIDVAGAWEMLLAREIHDAGLPVDWAALGK